MMNLVLAIPIGVRLAIIAAIGAALGALANVAIYSWAWRPRQISPWTLPPPVAPPRSATDRIPIVGWCGLRREAFLHGSGFWIRPMLLEFACAIGLAALYWWETSALGLIAPQWPLAGPLGHANLVAALHSQFLAHAVLALFMLVGTFIDIDEKIIPDEVTVIGTIAALGLALLLPLPLLPHVAIAGVAPAPGIPLLAPGGLPLVQPAGQLFLEPLHLAAPNDYPGGLRGAPRWHSLAFALACYWLWCFALSTRIWRGRRGAWRALELIVLRSFRDLASKPLRNILLLGTLAIVVCWWWNGPSWVALLSALVGLVVSGGTVWIVRIVGSAALRREAMGFGDVTLMMMIGAFVGWQASLIIFFLAPLAGVVIGVLQLILKHDDVIPYGPFLCLAAATVLVGWAEVWNRTGLLFAMPGLLAMVLVACFMLLGAMLAVWRVIRGILFG